MSDLFFKNHKPLSIDIKLNREGYKEFETQIEVSSGKKFYTFALQRK